MILTLLLAGVWLVMSGAVLTAIAIGATRTPIDGFDDGVDDLGRVILVLLLAFLLIVQSIIWLVIGATYGGAW